MYRRANTTDVNVKSLWNEIVANFRATLYIGSRLRVYKGAGPALREGTGTQNALYILPRALYMISTHTFICSLAMLDIERKI